MRFRKARLPILAPDKAKRQGEITQLAFLLLGRDAAITFLNSDHAELRGRPLELATASEEGRNRVEAEIGRMVYAPTQERALDADHRQHPRDPLDDFEAGDRRGRRSRDPAEAHFRRLGEAVPSDEGNT